jgi:hypothetical protein
VKNGYLQKPPVTSSNCYETMKNASIVIKLGTNVDCLCNDMLSLNFPVTMATRGHLKIAKNHYFALIFFHQNLFRSAATSQRIEIESKAFQHWLHVTL